jgi:hypothetical protein
MCVCVCIYKIIANIIASRLEPILSRFFVSENFGFLHEKLILDVIGVGQETLYIIKKKVILDFRAKLYLSKAYDRVILKYLRLIMIHIGVSFPMVN